MKLPYEHLSLFVIGTLASVFIIIIFTENFLSSSGFEYREKIFNCLILNLKEKNVTDDNFPSPVDLSGDDILTVDCGDILKQFNVLEDVKKDLHSSYNVTLNFCNKFSDDKNVKKFCDNDGEEIDNQSKSSANRTHLCVDLKEYFSGDEISQYESLDELFEERRENCENVNSCYLCIKENLSDDYENTMLHAIAVNYTIIEFKVWNYFTITERVQKLANEANEKMNDAVKRCHNLKKCVDLKVE